MKVIRTVEELKSVVGALKAEGKSVGLVPTMGALHDGHVSLMEKARGDNDVVVVSVFVNPTQFNNPDDLRTYPRTEEADCARMRDAGVDIAFIPSVEEIYPEPDNRVFDLGKVAEVMEGAMRPGHFNGVAQIVSKLFRMVEPTRAYFGEKDFQQIAVIRRMVEIEGFKNLEIVDCPIKREADGLALSSRNVRLTPHQREIAPNIHRIMVESLDKARDCSVEEVKRSVIDAVNAYPEMDVEYYEIVNAADMQPITDWSQATQAVGCITVYLGDVRLIDNIKYTI
ncbi:MULTISPECIES: pantoate--beta-alanine ligase [Muribaculum]|jgi:pantoate--beta-alanine ligase|uniref:pantoate--beta-alanine ligase n=1 Tax=Muribaculum TaxID=1918540 RepID=UPI0010940090|nr:MULTISPECIES: pantoate--beta-alanine ligase [Muribaculum]MCX4278220.1 pantoate--beta-alanine ligase [Muribaculum sp.]TGY02035.1 pantoate--beta-alanine ligase [Muribaculum sp. NM65_B17]THG40047.1 pantoate--beta-alanine ligase [Muribaculaceae bacterium]